jgi:hypothetical protein
MIELFGSTLAKEFTMEWERIASVSPFFRHPLRPVLNLATCPSSPAAREPIFVVISIDLLRKRRVMTKDVNVSNVRERWTGC